MLTNKAALVGCLFILISLTQTHVPTTVGAIEAPKPPMRALKATQLLDGDIVLIRGRGLMSATVLTADREGRYSHVGLYFRLDGRDMVIHAVPDENARQGGVRLEPLDAFLAADQAADFAIYRATAATATQRKMVKAWAFATLGRPFDFALRYSDDAALYCSELVVKSYDAADIRLRPDLRTVRTLLMEEPAIVPDGLTESPALTHVM